MNHKITRKDNGEIVFETDDHDKLKEEIDKLPKLEGLSIHFSSIDNDVDPYEMPACDYKSVRENEASYGPADCLGLPGVV